LDFKIESTTNEGVREMPQARGKSVTKEKRKREDQILLGWNSRPQGENKAPAPEVVHFVQKKQEQRVRIQKKRSAKRITL